MHHMEAVLEDVQFLANSPNRIRVLEALTNGPTTRRELQDETGVARSTVARALDEAGARGWVESMGSRYRITSSGEMMVAEFRRFVERTRGIRQLGAAFEWLPERVYELDFRHLRTAEVTAPTVVNPTAPFDRGLELIRDADEYRGLTQNSFPEYMRVIRDRVERGRLEFQGVIEAGFVESIRSESERRSLWRDVAHRTWAYEGKVPINMHVLDGTAVIWLCDEDQDGDDVFVKGLLESDHPDVVSWAQSLFEEFRSESDPLDPAVLSA